MLNILSNLENCMIFKIYNQKSQDKDKKVTVERKLTTIDISEKAIICKDFNTHYL